MDQATHNKIVSFIWGIADDVLRDLFKRGKYPDVILPMCVIRRMDAVLEPTKAAVLETKKMLDDARITEQRAALCDAAGQAFYNTSKFTLRDLKSRGLLEDTLVVWGGEFGRTPMSEKGDGRDHNPTGFTMWMAGGGVKAGTSYGETDDFSYNVAKDPVHVHDLHATILHLLGIHHERFTYRHQGLDFRLTGVEPAKVVKGIVA